MESCGITGTEYSKSYSDVPELIDFFKSEMPLREDRHMGKQEYLCRPGSQQCSVGPAASPERAIADSEERQLEPILVDFFKSGNGDLHLRHHGLEAPVINRSSSSVVEAKQHPMRKLKLDTGDHWSAQVANPLQALKMVLSPTSTGTAESGTAAPKTPTCDMEIAYSRPYPDHNESSAHQGSTIQFSHGCSKLPSGEVCADSGTSHGRLRDPPEGEEDEETDAVVQAATSLLSLASNESTRRRRRRRRSSSSDVSPRGSPVESERELDDEAAAGQSSVVDGACSSVLYRPTNKRRYKLVVDLLAETPTIRE